MSNPTRCTREQVIQAIHDSHGIASVAARRLGVGRATFYRYLDRWATCRQALSDARAAAVDLAESVVIGNIQAAAEQQRAEPDKVVDSSDAKWLLGRLGRDRGYGAEAEIDLGGEVTVVIGFKDGDDLS